MRPGDQVWAKVEGYRWWPATVQDPREHPEVAARGNGGKERLVVVRFHQTRDLAALPTSKVVDFETHLAEKSAGGKKSGGFAQAVAAAKEALLNAPRDAEDRRDHQRQGEREGSSEQRRRGASATVPGDDSTDARLDASRRLGGFAAGASSACDAAFRRRPAKDASRIAKNGSKPGSNRRGDGDDATSHADPSHAPAAASDFERDMRAFTGAADPAAASAVASLGEHLSEIGALRGRAAAAAAAAAARGEAEDTAVVRGRGEAGVDFADAAPARRPRRDAAVAAAAGITASGASRHDSQGSPAPEKSSDKPSDKTPPANSNGVGSKSCHQCSKKHPARECRAPARAGGRSACGLSYCDGCLRRHYPALDRDAAAERCPRCRGQCACASCVRERGGGGQGGQGQGHGRGHGRGHAQSRAREPSALKEPSAPKPPHQKSAAAASSKHQILTAAPDPLLRVTPERRARMCAHLLRHVVAPLRRSAAAEREEMEADAETTDAGDAEDAMDASHATGWRLFCDMCSSPVANMHRSCWACEVDVCVECCADVRRGRGVAAPGGRGKPVAALASTLVMKKGNGGGGGSGGGSGGGGGGNGAGGNGAGGVGGVGGTGIGAGTVSGATTGAARTRRALDRDVVKPEREDRPAPDAAAAVPVPVPASASASASASAWRMPPKKRLKLAAVGATSETAAAGDAAGVGTSRDTDLAANANANATPNPNANANANANATLTPTPTLNPNPKPNPHPNPTVSLASPKLASETRPCAEPLLCASCTRPLDLRSCVDRKWLDAVFDSPHVAAAETAAETETEDAARESSDRCAICDALPASEVRASRRTNVGPSSADPGRPVWCPRARDVAGWPADAAAEATRDAALAHFSWHWRRGHPIVVRDVDVAESDWTPEALERALREGDGSGSGDVAAGGGAAAGRAAHKMVRVVACGDEEETHEGRDGGGGSRGRDGDGVLDGDGFLGCSGGSPGSGSAAMTPRDFFRGYRDASAFTDAIGDASLFRLGAWGGTGAGFREALPAAHARFLASLPFPEYAHPSEGPLNLAAHTPKRVGPDDPGPRVVASHGAREERGVGDSVLRLRAAVTDRAVAVVHSFDAVAKSGASASASAVPVADFNPGSAAAPPLASEDDDTTLDGDAVVLWHVFRREDAAGLRERLRCRTTFAADFRGGGSRYLASGELARLAEPTEPGAAPIAPWRVPLRDGEMVLVPAGCPAQCRHLKSCVTVSLDFTAPESADASLETFSETRERGGGGAVAARTTLLHAARAAVDALDEREREQQREQREQRERV